MPSISWATQVNIFNNELGSWTECTLCNFADDIKLGGLIDTPVERNGTSCTWERITSCTKAGKQLCKKKKNGMKECSRKGWRWVSNMPLQQISPTAFLIALRKVFPGQGSYYLYYAPARLHLEYVFNSGLPSTRIMWTCWSKSSKGPLRSWRDCSTFHMRKDWEILDCLALKKKVQEEPYWWVWMSE